MKGGLIAKSNLACKCWGSDQRAIGEMHEVINDYL